MILGLIVALCMMVVPAMALTYNIIDSTADDEKGTQVDLNQVEITIEGGVVTAVSWQWDNTAWTGGNTGDSCSLFDSDGDGNANYALCVRVGGDPADYLTTNLFSCGDNKADRCTSPNTLIASFSSTCDADVVANSDPFGVSSSPFYTPSHVTGATCINTPDCYTDDTENNCIIDDASLQGASLVNVCSFESGSPNSNPNDCIVIDPCAAVNCDDDNACTTDSCAVVNGAPVCSSVDTVTPTCQDTDLCTTDTCVPATGLCKHEDTVTASCDDKDDCTDDSCVPATGECLYEDNGQCNPWCGLTIGYWKNNIKKYQNDAGGRQVCDAYFEGPDLVDPSEVCFAVTPSDSSCTLCGWQCIYDRLDKPGRLPKNTIAQMTGAFLTEQAEGEFGDFVIDTSLYKPLYCTDTIEPIDLTTCVYPACKAKLEAACGGSTCDVGVIWEKIAYAYAHGDLSTAQSLAGCINEFNDECKWTGDPFTAQQCE